VDEGPVTAELVPPVLRALFDRLDEVGRVTFAQPSPLMNMNHRQHWSKRNRLTRAWRDAACWAALEQLGSTPTARARCACFVAVVLPVRDLRRRDPSNLAPTQKAIVDGLVGAGVWPDDTPEWVTTVEPVLRVTPELVRGGPRYPEVVVHLLARDQRGAA
jgi:crossover junction endodeoxyribonuclease RusA